MPTQQTPLPPGPGTLFAEGFLRWLRSLPQQGREMLARELAFFVNYNLVRGASLSQIQRTLQRFNWQAFGLTPQQGIQLALQAAKDKRYAGDLVLKLLDDRIASKQYTTVGQAWQSLLPQLRQWGFTEKELVQLRDTIFTFPDQPPTEWQQVYRRGAWWADPNRQRLRMALIATQEGLVQSPEEYTLFVEPRIRKEGVPQALQQLQRARNYALTQAQREELRRQALDWRQPGQALMAWLTAASEGLSRPLAQALTGVPMEEQPPGTLMEKLAPDFLQALRETPGVRARIVENLVQMLDPAALAMMVAGGGALGAIGKRLSTGAARTLYATAPLAIALPETALSLQEGDTERALGALGTAALFSALAAAPALRDLAARTRRSLPPLEDFPPPVEPIPPRALPAPETPRAAFPPRAPALPPPETPPPPAPPETPPTRPPVAPTETPPPAAAPETPPTRPPATPPLETTTTTPPPEPVPRIEALQQALREADQTLQRRSLIPDIENLERSRAMLTQMAQQFPEHVEQITPRLQAIQQEIGKYIRIQLRLADERLQKPPDRIEALQSARETLQRLAAQYPEHADEIAPRITRLDQAIEAASRPKIDQYPEIPALHGKEATAYTAKGTPIPVRYAIVELDDLIPSHLPRGSALVRNERYPQPLQPRAREELAYLQQIQGLNRPPETLGESAETNAGAPIIGKEGIVESGNGRVLALMRSRDRNSDAWRQYQNWLRQKAPELGIDPTHLEAMRAPVLVRLREGTLPLEERAQLAQEMGMSSGATFTAVDRAKMDAQIIQRAGLLRYLQPSDSLTSRENVEFVRRFLNELSLDERAELIDEHGDLSRPGLQRLQAALLALAVPDERVLRLALENTDTEVNAVLQGVAMAAPKLAEMEAAIERGEAASLYSLKEPLRAVILKLNDLRRTNRSVLEYLEQGNLFGEQELTPFEQALLVFFAAKRGARPIAKALKAYAEEALRIGAPKAGMEELETPIELPSPRTLLSRAITGGQSDLFAEAPAEPTFASKPKPPSEDVILGSLFGGLQTLFDRLAQRPEGRIHIEKPKRDFSAGMYFRSPITIRDVKGRRLSMHGFYDSTPEGRRVADAITQAQERIMMQVHEWHLRIQQIVQKVEEARRAAGRRDKERFLDEWITLVELEKTDPRRQNATGALAEAIQLHDELTEAWRQAIIELRRAYGIETPDDWGITAQGYFRHLFAGNVVIRRKVMRPNEQGQMEETWEFVNRAPNYFAALKAAQDHLQQHPNDELRIGVEIDFSLADPTVRVSTRRYFGLVNRLADRLEVSGREVMEDLRGVIGRKASKRKFLSMERHREGYQGYLRDYQRVMELTAAQVARATELSRLKRTTQPLIENLRRKGYLGLAEEMERHLDVLWGSVSPVEAAISQTLLHLPLIGQFVPANAYAFRSLAQKITALQSWLKLEAQIWKVPLVIRPAIVNLTDPLRTLFPFVSTRELAWAYVQLMRPAVRQELARLGVWDISIPVRVDEGVLIRGMRNGDPSWFRRASMVNRAVGYLIGRERARQEGLSEEEAHLNGLRWARRTEYDNSAWYAAPILRSPIGRILFQFKGYTQKAIEDFFLVFSRLEREAFGRGGGGGQPPEQPPAGGEKEPFSWWLARVIKYIAGQLLVSGIKGLLGVWGMLLGGYLLYQQLKEALKRERMRDEDAEKIADALYWGAPALLGVDLTLSTAIFEAPFGFTPEERIVNLFGGPTVGTLIGLYEEQDLTQKVKRITPAGRWLEVAPQLYEGKTEIQIGKGKRAVNKLTREEAFLYALGFQPLRRSKYYEQREQQANRR
jgi:hypothetical protein